MGNWGGLAQLVEHRTENPCVPGSSPGSTTSMNKSMTSNGRAFCFLSYCLFLLQESSQAWLRNTIT